MNFDIYDFHADDYGLSNHTTDDITNLMEIGALDSISFLANMKSFEYAVKKFKLFRMNEANKKIQVSVHLNFIEGHCCAALQNVSLLCDKQGYFKISWEDLFVYNYLPLKRQIVREQLKNEIIAQTEKLIDSGVIEKDNLRFDGHQHTQMIPVVLDALNDAIKYFEQKGCKTTFIRNTEDPISPYLRIKQIRKSAKKINIIKCLILNFFSKKMRMFLKNKNLPVSYLCGVFFSGHNDFNRLEKILPFYEKIAIHKRRTIELLFHPGTLLKNEISDEFTKKDALKFYLSNGRKIENETLRNFLMQKQS